MTDKEALEKTLTLWEFLVAHPKCKKEEAYRSLKLTMDVNFCPLCEHARSPRGIDCNRCLLHDFWPKSDTCLCMSLGSSFFKWCYAFTTSAKTRHAKRIAEAVREKLNG